MTWHLLAGIIVAVLATVGLGAALVAKLALEWAKAKHIDENERGL